jgi:hypothetical protein
MPGGKPGRPRTNTVYPKGEKFRATIYFSAGALQKLDVHGAMLGMDRSELLERLIHDHLTRYEVIDHEATADGAGQGAGAAKAR